MDELGNLYILKWDMSTIETYIYIHKIQTLQEV